MSDALRELTEDDYWLYGPRVHEFDEVVALIQKYSDYADACVEQMISGSDVSPEFADAHVEVSADLRYYNHIEKGLLWSFALWRLQGMFEAVLVAHYLAKKPPKPLLGLKAKLQAVAAEGFRTPAADVAELLAWANLRNLLSHSPPRALSPCGGRTRGCGGIRGALKASLRKLGSPAAGSAQCGLISRSTRAGSQKIEDVLQVLAGIRGGYQPDKPEPLRRVRVRVVRQIAKQRGVDYQTIADAYIRRPAPDIEPTPAFEQLVEDWLASGSQSLQHILEEHALDQGDQAPISEFFASPT